VGRSAQDARSASGRYSLGSSSVLKEGMFGAEEGTKRDGARVLVAEDEAIVALDLETMLRGFG
jgi:hypothetical protein